MVWVLMASSWWWRMESTRWLSTVLECILLKLHFIYFFKDVNTAVRKVQRSVTRHRMPAKDWNDPWCFGNVLLFSDVKSWPVFICQIKGLKPELWDSQECLQNVSNTSLLWQCSLCHLENQMKLWCDLDLLLGLQTGQQAALLTLLILIQTFGVGGLVYCITIHSICNGCFLPFLFLLYVNVVDGSSWIL